MKNSKILRSVFLLMIFGALSFAFISPDAGGMKPVKPVKAKAEKKKHMELYYFMFYCSNGDQYVVKGLGSAASGSIEYFVAGCVGGTYYSSGTVSGSYTVSGGVATLT